MRTRNDRKHPALKHGAYSATAVLPGESRAVFEKLHRDLVAEFSPTGALEEDIVMSITRLLWRKQNLTTLRIAERACARRNEIEELDLQTSWLQEKLKNDPVFKREAERLAENTRAKEVLGDLYELTEVGEAATFNGLTKELEIGERLDAAINKCLKQLLMVRGVKSITAAPSSTSPKRITGPTKAA